MSDDLRAAEALAALQSLDASRIEYKSDVPTAVLDIDNRDVTTLFSVDNLDDVGDITEVGAFKRSIDHRGDRIPHLYMHDLNQPAIARILSFQTLTRAELPTDVQQKHPDATGGMACVSRYLKSGRGAEVYDGIKEGIPYQASFGYKALDIVRQVLTDGRKARRIKELAFYEVSTTPPGHAANDATRTTLGKALAMLEELKAGRRHSRSDVDLLREIARIAYQLGADNMTLLEDEIDALTEAVTDTTPAPSAKQARTVETERILGTLATLFGG